MARSINPLFFALLAPMLVISTSAARKIPKAAADNSIPQGGLDNSSLKLLLGSSARSSIRIPGETEVTRPRGMSCIHFGVLELPALLVLMHVMCRCLFYLLRFIN